MDNTFIKDALQPIKYVDSNGEVKTIDPNEILNFDKNNIPFESTANTYFLIARLAERTRLESKDLATQLDALKGKLYIAYVQNDAFKKINNGKKPPESMLQTAIESDANYIKLSNRANQVEYQYRLLNWLLKALEMKSNMMQSASANKRAELKMTPNSYTDISKMS